MLAIMIMAAGQASRFGACKQLAEYQGKPLLQHAIEKAQVISPNHVYVISGAWHQALVQAQQQGKVGQVPLLFNPDWQQGLGQSIAFGVKQLAAKYQAIMILLADQLLVSTEDLSRLYAAYEGSHIVCSLYQHKRGVPAVFPSTYFTQLQQLTGDKGAKSLLYHDDSIKKVNMPNARFDMDTPTDILKLG